MSDLISESMSDWVYENKEMDTGAGIFLHSLLDSNLWDSIIYQLDLERNQ